MSPPLSSDCEQCGHEVRGGVTRRGLLAGAAATSAGAAIAAMTAGTASADPGEEVGISPDPLPVLVGTVAETGPERLLVAPVQSGRSKVVVALAPGGSVWRLGAAKLGDYQVGDDVSAYGTLGPDGVLAATMVTCDLYSVQGPVRAPGPNSITIGQTPLRVGPGMFDAQPADEVGEFRPVSRAQVPSLVPGTEASALFLRNLMGPGLVWKLGAR